MAIHITKYVRYVPWDDSGVGASRRGSANSLNRTVDLSQYYTKIDLQTAGLAQVHFDNITEAYHNNLLGLQGGKVITDSSGTPSSEGDDELYHLDEETYTRVVTWEFLDSLIEESDGTIHLINDEDNPGLLKYYGTDISGVKGWYNLPEESSSETGGGVDVYGTPEQHYVTMWHDANTITSMQGDEGVGFYSQQWVGGYNILHAPFGAIVGGEYSWKSAPYYLNDRFAITALDGDETYPNGTNILIWSGQCWDGGGLSGKIRIHVSDSISATKAHDLELIGSTNEGVGSGNDEGGSGGDVYIESGYSFSDDPDAVAGDVYISTGYKYTYYGNDVLSKGFIYFGDKYEGCLPEADTEQVYGVTYDPVTGKLSYAYLGSIGSGGGGVSNYVFDMSLIEDSSGVVTLENDLTSPGNNYYYGTDSSGSKGWHELTKGFQTATFANPLNIDCTTYKDWICTVTDDCTVNLNNVEDGDAGMLELIIDASGVDITFGTMWTKKLGLVNLDSSDGADNIISWRAIGDGSTQEIIYTIGQIEV